MFSFKNKNEKKPNALVMDVSSSQPTFGMEYVEKPKGKLWLYRDQWVYWLKSTTKIIETENKETGEITGEAHVEYEEITPQKSIDYPPESLYEGLNWPEANILFALKANFMEKVNMVLMVVFAGILLFFGYLIISSLQG
jgi:hypothetical protein